MQKRLAHKDYLCWIILISINFIEIPSTAPIEYLQFVGTLTTKTLNEIYTRNKYRIAKFCEKKPSSVHFPSIRHRIFFYIINFAFSLIKCNKLFALCF